MQFKLDKDKLLSSVTRAVTPPFSTLGLARGLYKLARPNVPSKLPSMHDVGRFASRARVQTSVLPQRTLGKAQLAIGKYGQQAQRFFGLEQEAKDYQSLNRQVRSSKYPLLSRERLARNIYPLYAARKTIPAVSATLDTAETLLSAGLRRKPGTTFRERLGEELKSGTGFVGVLQSRGVPTKYALPVGLVAGMALPGAGDIRKAKVGKELVEEGVSKAGRKLAEDAGASRYAHDLLSSLEERVMEISGFDDKADSIYKELVSLGKRFKLPFDPAKERTILEKKAKRLLRARIKEGGLTYDSWLQDQFGTEAPVVKKMISFLNFAGERRSKASGELFREHIPANIFGKSSDEVATELGMNERELMGKLNDIAAGELPASEFVERLPSNKVKWSLDALAEKNIPGVEINTDKYGLPVSVTAGRIEKPPTAAKMDELLARDARVGRYTKGGATRKRTVMEAISGVSRAIEQNTKGTVEGAIQAPPEVHGGIRAPVLRLDRWKDKRTPFLSRETLDRNLRDVAPKEDYARIKKFLIDRSRENGTKYSAWLTKNAKEVENFVKRVGIRRGSKEDALIQKFGEGDMSLAELKSVAPEKWEAIKQSAKFFRKKYDNILDAINRERGRFGYAPIPKRKDYFRHFQDIGNVINSFGVILKKESLPTEIAGRTDLFKPGKPFTTAELQRKGGKYTLSAIGGFEDYIGSVGRQIFHLDTVQRGRALEKYIDQVAVAGGTHLPNLKANILEWTNLVSGKKARLDRAFESVAGREIYGIANYLRRKLVANMVGGNLSSALTNFIPFTQSLATTDKKAVVKGLLDTLSSPLLEDPAKIGSVRSGFLTRRFVKQGIAPRGVAKAGEIASTPFKLVDAFTSRAIVAGKYFENLAKGMSPKKAMKLADEYAGNLLTDRSIGQLPNMFSTKTLGFWTQFQTEVNNQASFLLKDIPNMSEGDKKRLASALAQFILYSYLFNSAYEKATGRRPQIDPIQAGLHLLGKDSGEGDTTIDRLTRAGGDIIPGVPLVGTRLPIASALPRGSNIVAGIRNLGKERYRAGIGQIASELYRPAYYIAPPFGGSQLKKTVEGLGAYLRGYSQTPTGRERFKVERTPANLARSVTLGQWATKNAREYIKGGFRPHKRAFASTGAQKQLPTTKKELAILYKDALSTLNRYPANKVRAVYGKSGKTLEEYQQEANEALATKRAIERKYPKVVLDLEFKDYGKGGSRSVAERAKWAITKLSRAAGTKDFDLLAKRMYKDGVLTDAVVDAIEKEYGKVLPYRKDMGVTSRGKSRYKRYGKTSSGVRRRKTSIPRMKMPKTTITGRRLKKTGISFYDYLNRR